jgi:hypothetical protein
MSLVEKYEKIALELVEYLTNNNIDTNALDKSEIIEYIKKNSTIH